MSSGQDLRSEPVCEKNTLTVTQRHNGNFWFRTWFNVSNLRVHGSQSKTPAIARVLRTLEEAGG